MPPHPFESARDATLAALARHAQADPRIEALWLQGSLATGEADPFSDVDAYLPVGEGPPTAQVLVDCDEGRFHRWAMPRLLGQPARS